MSRYSYTDIILLISCSIFPFLYVSLGLFRISIMHLICLMFPSSPNISCIFNHPYQELSCFACCAMYLRIRRTAYSLSYLPDTGTVHQRAGCSSNVQRNVQTIFIEHGRFAPNAKRRGEAIPDAASPCYLLPPHSRSLTITTFLSLEADTVSVAHAFEPRSDRKRAAMRRTYRPSTFQNMQVPRCKNTSMERHVPAMQGTNRTNIMR